MDGHMNVKLILGKMLSFRFILIVSVFFFFSMLFFFVLIILSALT